MARFARFPEKERWFLPKPPAQVKPNPRPRGCRGGKDNKIGKIRMLRKIFGRNGTFRLLYLFTAERPDPIFKNSQRRQVGNMTEFSTC
jgi:hypothetical protein